MYLSRIELAPGAPESPAFWSSLRSAYDTHRLVWGWFSDGPERRRDFLFRQEGAGMGTRFYTVSERPPHDATGLWRMESKPYAPKLVPGQPLQFTLRANPTRRIRTGDGGGRRHDVVMDSKRREPEAEDVSPAERVQREGARWLAERLAKLGAEVRPEAVRVDGYQQVRLPRRAGEAPIRLSTLEFTGLLTVTEPERFSSALTQGVGPAKAFGCGLLLVRRV